MAKKAPKKKIVPWVKFEKDPKTGSIMLSRMDHGDGFHRLQFPRPGDVKGARILFESEDGTQEDGGLYLDYSDVQWLAQALPELLNEMERAGVD